MALTVIQKPKSIRLKDFAITDPEVIDVILDLPEEEDRIEFISRAIRVGTLALKSTQVMEKVDYIQKEVSKMQTEVLQHVNTCFGDGGKVQNLFDPANQNGPVGQFLAKVQEYFGEKGTVPDLFSPSKTGGPVQQLIAQLTTIFGPEGTIRKMLDATEEGSPLAKLRTNMEELINNLRKDLAVGEALEEQAVHTPLPGYAYEDEIQVELEFLASACGDEVIDVSTVAGAGTGKKGDFLINVKDATRTVAGKITVEAKDRDITLGGKGNIQGILDHSLATRGATYGIATVKDRSRLPKTQADRVGTYYPMGDNKILVVASTDEWLPLEVAYKVLRARLLLGGGKKAEINLVNVEAQIQNTLARIGQLKGIRTTITKSIKGAADDVSEKIRALQTQLEADLAALKEEIFPAEPDALAGDAEE